MTKRLTDEQKVAKQLAKIVSDITLDLDLVGFYLAHYEATITHNRLNVIAESADYEKERLNDRQHLNPLF